MLGIAIIVLAGTSLDSSLVGNVLIVGSSTCWAVYTVLGRHTFAANDSFAVLAGIAVVGLIQMAPLAVYESFSEGLSQIQATDWLYVVYLGLGPSAAAYMLVGYALSHLEASQVAVFGNIGPFAGALAGYVFLGEYIGVEHVVGGAFIVLGVWLATQSPARRNAARRREGTDGSVERTTTG
jgi:drug/metabolite transporter (DMT)-like permease